MRDEPFDGGKTSALPSLRVSFDDASAVEDLTSDLDRVLFRLGERRLTVVCVGTDRSTGDAFGPIVGTKLKRSVRWPWIDIFGTLDEPVHAVNLSATLEEIDRAHTVRPYIIAIDACLGKFDHVGQIIMEPGPLRPGAGVKKSLPAFGDYTLTGVVNVSGFMEYFVLQNTRLGIVMRMSEVVVDALLASFHKLAMRRAVIGAAADRAAAASQEPRSLSGGTLPTG